MGKGVDETRRGSNRGETAVLADERELLVDVGGGFLRRVRVVVG